MARKEIHQKVTAVVPAYNEAKRIGRVLDVLTTYPGFLEVIVVDDGSKDDTVEVIKNYPIRLIKNSVNKGKGAAMDLGLKKAKSEIVFFVDADVSGLNHEIIDQIIEPVTKGVVDMFIGMRNRKLYLLHSIVIFVPLLGGERALTKKLWNSLPSYYKHRFRVEAGLNFYAQYYGNGFQYKVFKGLKQVIKEKKYGFFEGLKQRFGMMLNVFQAQLKLQLVDIPRSARNRRFLRFIALQSLLGVILGVIILAAVYFGPRDFVLRIFNQELQEDPSAPFVHFLLYLTNITAVSTFVVLGIALLITNSTMLFLTFKKLGGSFLGMSRRIESQK